MEGHQPKYFIVVFGPPASGKSTLAKHIRQLYHQQHKQRKGETTSFIASPDCFEEYLRHHSLQQLPHSFEAMEKVMSLKLRRAQFDEQRWRLSRAFVRENLPKWLQMTSLLILQDDMLLKSQRKYFRHIAQQNKDLLYLQICINATLEQCLFNLQARADKQEKEYCLSPQTCKQAYKKFEIQENPYLISLRPKQPLQWRLIRDSAKIVQIDHNEIRESKVTSVEQAQKDVVQVKIRKFISEIMSNKYLQNKYFPLKSIKEVSSFFIALKKKFRPKAKTFEGFLCLFKSETENLT